MPQETMTQEQVRKLIGGAAFSGPAKDPSQGRYGKQHTTGEMNKTEAAFSRYLDELKSDGKIHGYEFEPVSWRYISDDKSRRYSPDFLIDWIDLPIEFVEVKADYRHNEASDVRLAATSERFKHLRHRFTFSQYKKTKLGWKRREF